MFIKVRYRDGSSELVRPSLLQYLIQNKRIAEFLRKNGWATVGIDPVREKQVNIYDGPERRKVSFRM